MALRKWNWTTGETWGIALALAGALLFSTKAVLVKLAYQYEVDSLTLLFLRMAFALPFYLMALAAVRKDTWVGIRRLDSKYWWGLLAAGFLGYYASSFLDFEGLKYIDASIERLILFIYPAIIAVLAYFIFGERMSVVQRWALAISYLGLVFVFWSQLGSVSLSDDFWWGASLILICALTFGSFLLMSQWLVHYFGSSAFTSLSMVAACSMVCIHFLLVSDVTDVIPNLPWQVYIYAVLMAVFATVVPSYLVNMAIRRIGAIRMAIVSSVGPFSTICLAYLLLDERLVGSQILGAICIVVGVTVISIERKRQSRTLTTQKT